MKRDPDKTRQDILLAAFDEIHRHGFQAASVDRILARTGVTKGALYHHFPNKKALGYAVVDELVRGWFEEEWVRPFRRSGDPLDQIAEGLGCVLGKASDVVVELGCPLNNLTQEMSPVDEGFRRRLQGILDDWRESLSEGLARGQREGSVRSDIDPGQVAGFLVAAIEGIHGAAKNAQSADSLRDNFAVLRSYLETLRSPKQPEQSKVA